MEKPSVSEMHSALLSLRLVMPAGDWSTKMAEPKFVRVVAPHFVAGLDIGVNGKCVEAAPILAWAKGKSEEELRTYFRRKGWTASIINPQKHAVQL